MIDKRVTYSNDQRMQLNEKKILWNTTDQSASQVDSMIQ